MYNTTAIAWFTLLQIKHSKAASNPYSCSQVLQTSADESALLGTERGMIQKVAIVQMYDVTQSEYHKSCMAPGCESELLFDRHGSQATHTIQSRSRASVDGLHVTSTG